MYYVIIYNSYLVFMKNRFLFPVSSVWISKTGSICHTHFTSSWQLECSITVHIVLFVEKRFWVQSELSTTMCEAFSEHSYSTWLYIKGQGNNGWKAIQGWGKNVSSPLYVEVGAPTTNPTITTLLWRWTGRKHVLVDVCIYWLNLENWKKVQTSSPWLYWQTGTNQKSITSKTLKSKQACFFETDQT